MVYNNVCIKDPFKLQEGQMDFNVTEYRKFNDIVWYSTLQLTHKKFPLIKLVLYQRRISKLF